MTTIATTAPGPREPEMTDPTPSTQPLIMTSGLTKTYGRTTALDSLDLELEGGRIIGLLVSWSFVDIHVSCSRGWAGKIHDPFGQNKNFG